MENEIKRYKLHKVKTKWVTIGMTLCSSVLSMVALNSNKANADTINSVNTSSINNKLSTTSQSLKQQSNTINSSNNSIAANKSDVNKVDNQLVANKQGQVNTQNNSLNNAKSNSAINVQVKNDDVNNQNNNKQQLNYSKNMNSNANNYSGNKSSNNTTQINKQQNINKNSNVNNLSNNSQNDVATNNQSQVVSSIQSRQSQSNTQNNISNKEQQNTQNKQVVVPYNVLSKSMQLDSQQEVTFGSCNDLNQIVIDLKNPLSGDLKSQVQFSNGNGIKSINQSGNQLTIYTNGDIDFQKAMTVTVDGQQYTIDPTNGMAMAVVRSQNFDNKYTYNGNDLGANYTSTATTFKLWAPTASMVSLNLYNNDKDPNAKLTGWYHMTYDPNTGVWTITIQGDLKDYAYDYLVQFANGKSNETYDPYATACVQGGFRSVVLSPEEIGSNVTAGKVVDKDDPTNEIIGEIDVRDFTNDPSSGVTANVRGTYVGAAQSTNTTDSKGNPTGINYLTHQGINTVQIQPMYQYDDDGNNTNSSYEYDWGYDPENYNVPEGWYSTNRDDPATRIKECKEMIQAFHDAGIRVNMDVVFNHVANVKTNALALTVPGYYFRYGNNGQLTNASACGDDVASERNMVRNYIVHSCEYWHKVYGVDGFRFDLMGNLDVKTLNAIRAALPDVVMYGEGWNMGANIPDSDKADQANEKQMPIIGSFNGWGRNVVRGSDDGKQHGYITGQQGQQTMSSLANYIWGEQNLPNTPSNAVDGGVNYANPTQIINYTECHDNKTLYDTIRAAYPNENPDVSMRRAELGNAITILNEGVPFVQVGQGFGRSKDGDGNSYRSGDKINNIHWDTQDNRTWATAYEKALIDLRNSDPAFKFTSYDQMDKNMKWVEINNDNGVIGYELTSPETGRTYIIAYSNNASTQQLTGLANGKYKVLIKNCNGYLNDPQVINVTNEQTDIPSLSCLVLEVDNAAANTPVTKPNAGNQSGSSNSNNQNKPSSNTPSQSKPSAGSSSSTNNQKPSSPNSNNNQNKPSQSTGNTSNNNNKPSNSGNTTKPSTGSSSNTNSQKPSSSTSQNKPSNSINTPNSKPSQSGNTPNNQKPSTGSQSGSSQQPSNNPNDVNHDMNGNKPSSSNNQNKPGQNTGNTSNANNQKPSGSTSQNKPNTSTNKPSTGNTNSNDTDHSQQPSSNPNDVNHDINGNKPSSSGNQNKPSSNTGSSSNANNQNKPSSNANSNSNKDNTSNNTKPNTLSSNNQNINKPSAGNANSSSSNENHSQQPSDNPNDVNHDMNGNNSNNTNSSSSSTNKSNDNSSSNSPISSSSSSSNNNNSQPTTSSSSSSNSTTPSITSGSISENDNNSSSSNTTITNSSSNASSNTSTIQSNSNKSELGPGESIFDNNGNIKKDIPNMPISKDDRNVSNNENVAVNTNAPLNFTNNYKLNNNSRNESTINNSSLNNTNNYQTIGINDYNESLLNQSQAGSISNSQNNNSNELPQTGDSKDELLIASAGLIGLLGISELKKKD